MLITTEPRNGAVAPVKDMDESVQRLDQASQQHDDLGQLAQSNGAQDAESGQHDVAQSLKGQSSAIRGGEKTRENPSPEMANPDLVLASSAGIAATSAAGTHMASQLDHAVTAGQNVSVSSGRSLFAAARDAILLFAYQLGMKLVAAKGRMELHAPSDQMTLTAQKDLTISSTEDRVVLTAAKEIWIGAGGSYIQINGAGIVNGSPGQILAKCASWSQVGPDSKLISVGEHAKGCSWQSAAASSDSAASVPLE